jgi:hypothetical protein
LEWSVGIEGDKSDLEDLAKSLKSPELCLTQHGEDFILKSTDFKHLKNANDVRNKACEIIAIINGGARLTLDICNPLTIGCVSRMTDDGLDLFPAPATDTLTVQNKVRVSIVDADGTIHENHPADPIPDWVAIAQNDKNVSDVLRRFGAGRHSWENLYSIYEIIEEDIGGMDNITSKRWAAKKTIRLFKHTANSPGAIGGDARHGVQKEKAPKEPMRLSEAKSLIETIFKSWLHSKSKKS